MRCALDWVALFCQNGLGKGDPMKEQSFVVTLRALLRRRPFRPFAVHLMNGSSIIVDHPEALVLRAGAAVFVDRHGVPAWFDEESVAQIRGARNGATR